jgi:hypothetical protein
VDLILETVDEYVELYLWICVYFRPFLREWIIL